MDDGGQRPGGLRACRSGAGTWRQPAGRQDLSSSACLCDRRARGHHLRLLAFENAPRPPAPWNVAPPRAPPRKWAPIMAFGRCSGTAPGLTPSFQLLHSLRDTGSSDNSASSGQKVVARQELLTSAELPHRELGLGQAPGPGHPHPTGLPHCLPHSSQPGLSPRPDPQPRGACTPPLAGCPGSLWPLPSTGHGLKEPRSTAGCLHGRGELSLISLQCREPALEGVINTHRPPAVHLRCHTGESSLEQEERPHEGN
ncbi:uncharacterized protein LOC124230372 isoform X3 [Equus quagga]|uniref:uncharacterized protein LOC124230372 isoform X3 n=1 Tax=Equus quagga TaxID=89248 RepID=UPI001EE30BE7|nr:uncharacterized protein LOC124230372 isoform X3 [Equus quagga]